MVGTIIYLIIIALIIRKVLKDKKRRTASSSARNKPPAQTRNSTGGYINSSNQKKKKKDNSILQSAKENVAQNDIDLMKEADRKRHETAKASLPDAGDGTDILKQVYDLIAMGYSGNLQFERDFLSEGMDMINRVGMPEGSVELLDFSVEGKF